MRQIRYQETRLRDVINAVPANVWSISPDGAVDFVNQRWQELTGLPADEALGWNWEAVVHPDDRAEYVARWRAAVKNGKPMEYEARVRRPGGEYRWLFIRNVPLRDSKANIVKWYGTGVDIEDRKRAEEKVQQSEQELRQIVDAVPHHIFVLEPNGRFLYVNRSDLEYSGLTLKDVYAADYPERIWHPDDWERLSHDREQAIAQGIPWQGEARLRGKDGEYRWFLIRENPMRDEQGHILRWYGTRTDIEDHKRAEEARQSYLWFLESMDRINRTVQGTSDLEQMMRDVLDAILSIFACDRAWLVYPCDPKGVSWRTVMERTRREFPGAFAMGVDFPMDPEVVRVHQLVRASSSAVRFGPEFENPVPTSLAQRFSVQSQILTALYPKVDKPYLFGLDQCTHPRVWRREEQALFEAIGQRLADTLTSQLMFRNLQESQARLEEAQRIAHVGYWAHDLATGRLTWSDETYRIFGLQPQERLVDVAGFHELIHPEDREPVARAMEEALAGGTRYNFEFRIVHPSGDLCIVHSQGDTKRDSTGQPCQMFGTVQDITNRNRALEALRRSEAYLAEAQRLGHTGSWAWDPKANEQVYFSEEMYRMLGLDPQHGLPSMKVIREIVHPEDRSWVRQEISNAVHEKRDYRIEYRVVRPDGTVRHFQSLGHPVLNATGEVIEVVGTHVDVTERKRAEEERERLRQLEADLAHINRVSTMGELAVSLAHEIKQPIAAAVTNAEACLRLLERDEPDIAEVCDAASGMAGCARRAAEIIDRVRALFAKNAPQYELVDVNKVIRDIVILLQNEARRNSVAVHLELAENLPGIMGDHVQLQQVMMNLILNGIEAMRNTTGGLNVTSQPTEDGYVLVSVRDTGIGLPAEKADKIFDAFFTTKPQGTGMGLAISRSIVESHGGCLWATANSGRGATFHFKLPHQNPERA